MSIKSPFVSRAAARSLSMIVAAGTLAALAGCASYQRDHVVVGSVPDDYRTRHPIIVTDSEEVRDILVPVKASRLDQRGQQVVRALGYSFRASGARSILIMIPSGSANEHAARKSAHHAVELLQRLRIKPSEITIRHYNAGGHGEAATLRLAYTSLKADVASDCGQWGEDLIDTDENVNYANFGCASQNNLAQMIANPADLLEPRGMTEIDSTKRTNVITEWRETTSDVDISN